MGADSRSAATGGTSTVGVPSPSAVIGIVDGTDNGIVEDAHLVEPLRTLSGGVGTVGQHGGGGIGTNDGAVVVAPLRSPSVSDAAVDDNDAFVPYQTRRQKRARNKRTEPSDEAGNC